MEIFRLWASHIAGVPPSTSKDADDMDIVRETDLGNAFSVEEHTSPSVMQAGAPFSTSEDADDMTTDGKTDSGNALSVEEHTSPSGFIGVNYTGDKDLQVVQIGANCTVIYLQIHEKVYESLRRDADKELCLRTGQQEVTIFWGKDLTDDENVEFQFKADSMDREAEKVLGKIKFLHGTKGVEIAEEFYRKYRSRLIKILSGSLTFVFRMNILDIKGNKTTNEICENIRLTLTKRLDAIYNEIDRCTGTHFKVTVLKTKKLSDTKRTYCSSYTRIEEPSIERLRDVFSTVRENKGIDTLICLDISSAIGNTTHQELLKRIFSNLNKGFAKTLKDEKVRMIEYYSLLICGEENLIYLGQDYRSTFPKTGEFHYFIDELSEHSIVEEGRYFPKGLELSFEISQQFGQTVSWNNYSVCPRIIYITNGNISQENKDICLAELSHMKRRPLTIIPVDENYDSDFLNKIASETGGEVTNDVEYVSGFLKQQQLIISALEDRRHDKNGILEFVKKTEPRKDLEMVKHLLDSRKDINNEIEKAVLQEHKMRQEKEERSRSISEKEDDESEKPEKIV